MPSTLSDHAIEGSSYTVVVDFEDGDGKAVNPVSLDWSLTDLNGDIINDRSGEVVASPSSTENITLSGNDLMIPTTDVPAIVLTLMGTYNSDYGNNLPIKDSVKILIDNLILVS